jgi:outer membrane immunogenic protein
MKRILLATVALTAFAASNAIAADIPARMPTKAPAYVAMYNWTGGYIGVNAGVGFTDSLSGNNDTGFIGGAQIGYNWQGVGSPWVFGIEADFQGSTQGASATVGGVTASADLNYFGTVRGRIGYAWDRVMLYATGGLAYQNVELSVTVPGVGTFNGDNTEFGWTLGGGLEWALWDRWTMKAEYLYIRTDDHTVTVPAFGTFGGDVENHVIRAGINYRF